MLWTPPNEGLRQLKGSRVLNVNCSKEVFLESDTHESTAVWVHEHDGGKFQPV
jgi:hypothetical protein